MANSQWKDLAYMLGVKLEEKFRITDAVTKRISPDLYWFTEKGLKFMSPDDDDSMTFNGSDATICRLLNGSDEVVKLDWAPQEGDEVWYLICDDSTHGFRAVSTKFNKYRLDLLLMLKHGMLYASRGAADTLESLNKAHWLLHEYTYGTIAVRKEYKNGK